MRSRKPPVPQSTDEVVLIRSRMMQTLNFGRS